ncbi:substrate-binding domain-containing protein [Crenobacter sp. SG2305]|uniref:helix-turn-helix transcriptional regulator n=1 Tax=Crenobacter oryzisoli TaxID=3056844 RepID=UPI0025AAB15D|nr:substrate-binding domain-containing protein [Crenobacter sp. SG2305]MDN0085667.1 substrate-binding domain-containing protein [Crenobacter sp. SG2305]
MQKKHKGTNWPRVTTRLVWELESESGGEVPFRLIELLTAVQAHGSLQTAAKETDTSYRHAWGLLQQAQAALGMALLEMERGKGSRLTPLAEKLVWANRRMRARMTPLLESLASEIETEIQHALKAATTPIRLHASHGFAVEKLARTLAASGIAIDLKYRSSQDAVAALHAGECDLAGFHVPLGEFQTPVARSYANHFDLQKHCLIHIVTRRQGLMVMRGNPGKIYDIGDLAREDLRFVNRQPGSGTRLLLDLLLNKQGISPSQVHGYEQAELTHAAVAAYVASGMADVGLGVETAARRFDLDFLPLQTERYFFLAQRGTLEYPTVEALIASLKSEAFRDEISRLPGYDAAQSGAILTVSEAFPELAP